jgi:hypothetical protein
MTIRAMTTGALIVIVSLGATGLASAASVHNAGPSSIVLVVVEDGNKMEVPVDAGASETICPAGCFLTLPNGDRIGLAGGETVEIVDGIATVK